MRVGSNSGIGQLTQVCSKVSTTNYSSFDALGRVLESRHTPAGSPTPYIMSYAYNRAGQMIKQTYPPGREIFTTYNTGVSNATGKILVYNRRTNEAATHTGTLIHTFFRPDNGEYYVSGHILEEGYKRIK